MAVARPTQAGDVAAVRKSFGGAGRCSRREVELLISFVQVGKWRIKVDVDLDCSGRR